MNGALLTDELHLLLPEREDHMLGMFGDDKNSFGFIVHNLYLPPPILRDRHKTVKGRCVLGKNQKEF